MRCVTVLELDHHAVRPELDTAIVWDDGSRLVAFAYRDGRVMMTRPLSNGQVDVGEIASSFQIPPSAITRTTTWAEAVEVRAPTSRPAESRARWGLGR